ncbi:hypothetical protein GCM10012290_22950 [Halolactibacillus alkaliphilus]|uniref:Hydrolase n=1 Tax=Halolactibacillus alkaliphilus TaxID=442899 RepID=A0A511X452_9BACI|nr:YiiX/YebB-like N1pC/P60 family cysteine hydrolase [Halolactibacillus alkaliphilus]GEN57695.1 hypothetical protein HAL01_21590 [Halolactibacillus alkaliphilus]GGN74745.1 hypothetical protein GCM10012290_22950 [Halolactibacillus alkaliphilus]SFP03153.1 Permuted papain-like amidase enzyme, YaeF/YiiX, C92 family [Halolactibacillus alkaliphilus]
MFRKFITFMVLLFTVTLLVYPNVSQAEELNNKPETDLSEETYNQLIENEIVDKKISYETWLIINNEDKFNEFDSEIPVPNELIQIEENMTSNIQTFSTGPTLNKGDILVSNGTSSFGLTGHAGIAISSTQVLHISGAKNSKPLVITTKQWQDRYGIVQGQKDGRTHTNVYRVGSRTNAIRAANWAKINYQNKNYSYSISMNLPSKNPTYCSKIVWQAYDSISAVKKPTTLIATPYGLPGYFKTNQNLKGVGII